MVMAKYTNLQFAQEMIRKRFNTYMQSCRHQIIMVQYFWNLVQKAILIKQTMLICNFTKTGLPFWGLFDWWHFSWIRTNTMWFWNKYRKRLFRIFHWLKYFRCYKFVYVPSAWKSHKAHMGHTMVCGVIVIVVINRVESQLDNWRYEYTPVDRNYSSCTIGRG